MKDFVKEYWDKNAQKFGGSHWASWGDNFMIVIQHLSKLRDIVFLLRELIILCL